MADLDKSEGDLSVSMGAAGLPTKWWIAVIETVVSVAVVAFLLRILSNSGRKYETDWIIVAVLPIVFWLFYSGRLVSFKAFGVELTAAIRRASIEQITPDRKIAYESVDPEEKADISRINDCIARKAPAISFELGRKSYYSGAAIRKYLEALLPYGFFRYVVFKNRDARFAAIMPAYKLYLAGSLREVPQEGFNELRIKIEDGDIGDLPGVVKADAALKTTDTKREAIEKFGKTDADELPVVNGGGVLVGVVSRGKLQSELLASIFMAASDKS